MAVCSKRKDAAFEIARNIKIEREENKMELKVKEFTIPEVIEFNFAALKKEITEKAALYKNMVYTEDQIPDAKKDRATLNKFNDALSAERIAIKKECLKPYEDFEAKVKELTGIVSEAITNIDRQVKEVEEKTKAKKLETIKEYFAMCLHPEWLKFEQIFDSKWLNASVTLKKAQEEMTAKLEQIDVNISTLQILPKFSFEAIEVYKESLDINKAMQEGKRLADIQKRKAEAQAEAVETPQTADSLNQMAEAATETVVEKTWIPFKALLSAEDAKALAEFFRSRNIQYSKI